MNKKAPKKYLTKSRKTRIVSQAMSELGRIGGRARARNGQLTPEERLASALKASKAAAKARTRKAKERQKGS